MNQLKYRVLGVMSGTSLDGLDLCVADFWNENDRWFFSIINGNTIQYTTDIRNRLLQAYVSDREKLNNINAEYGQFLGKTIKHFLESNKLNVDFIANHGHTVLHQPQNKITVQIGNGPEIFNSTRIPVVCDFRVQDVLLGGQGAPLVPIGDELLFNDYAACLNLGGFANISFESKGKRIAFDICPVNMVLNALSEKMGQPYDENGKIARSGTLEPALLEKLNQLDYYSEPPPKSLGREWVEKHIEPIIENYAPPAALATFVEHVAIQVGKSTARLNGEMLITGGGAFNSFLIERIKTHCGLKVHVPTDQDIINLKEALIFGFLGVLRWVNHPNCLATVTGAKANHSAGRIYR